MRCPLASLPRAVWVLLLIFFLVTLTASHPAVVPEDSSLSSNNIAAVADTGDITDLLESGEHTTPIATKIPTKAETAHQLNTYRVKPLTIAHQIEGLLTLFGLGKQTNFILDTLCLLAYAHLLRLTSQSSWYSMELVQFVGFFLFPALPFVQFANNLCRTIMNVLHDGNSGVRHALSCIIGQYATSAQPTSSQLSVLDEKAEGVEPSQPSDLFVRQRLTHVPQHELNSSSGVALHIVRRFGGILLAGLTITASITTLHIHVDHPVRSDWDSVGIASDQRHGWLAGGATLASLLSVIALVTNSRWTIKSDFTRPDTRAGILAEGEIFTELALSAIIQDLVAGFSGADSFAGYLADMTANIWGLLAVLCFIAIMNKRLLSIPNAIFGSRSRSRRNSDPGSRPGLVIASLLLCLAIGGYHIIGQVMAVQAATRHSAKSGVSFSEALSGADE